jgi:hypothetical protein
MTDGKQAFRCWASELGQTEDDGKVVVSRCARWAAEEFAEKSFTTSDPFNEIIVSVLPPNGCVVRYMVDVEATPTFHAWMMTEKEKL